MSLDLGYRKSDIRNAGPQGLTAWAGFGTIALACSMFATVTQVLLTRFSTHELAYASFGIGVALIVLLRRTVILPGSLAHRSTWHLATRHAGLVFLVGMLAGTPLALGELPGILLASALFALVSRFALRGKWRPTNA